MKCRNTFRQYVDEPIGPPVDGGQARAIRQHRLADPSPGLVGKHPDQLARGDNRGDVVAEHVSYVSPDPSQNFICPPCDGRACHGRRKQGLAVSAHVRHESIFVEHDV